MTTHTETAQPALVTLTVLKAANAPKLGKRSAGMNIHYRLWTDEQRQEIYWQIAANDGGGQHSLELVPTAKLESTLSPLAGKEPIRTRTLRSTFAGRSTNNAGFIVCALYAEGFLSPSDKAHHHAVSEIDWNAWRQSCLSLPGQSVELPLALATAALPADTADPVPKGRRSGKRKLHAEEGEEAHAPAD